MRRDELTTQSRERMESLLREMEAGTLENQRMGQLMVNLAQQLQTIGGRKQYGYLKAPLKALVDEIVACPKPTTSGMSRERKSSAAIRMTFQIESLSPNKRSYGKLRT